MSYKPPKTIRRLAPWKFHSIVRLFGSSTTLWFQMMLTHEMPQHTIHALDKIPEYAWLLFRNPVANDLNNQPARVDVEDKVENYSISVEDKNPYYEPPVVGHFLPLADETAAEFIKDFIEPSSSDVATAVNESAKEGLPKDSDLLDMYSYETAIYKSLFTGEIPKQLNAMSAVSVLEQKIVSERYLRAPSAEWVLDESDLNAYITGVNNAINDMSSTVESMTNSWMTEEKKYRRTLDAIMDSISVLESKPTQLASTTVLYPSDITSDYVGKSVVVAGYVGDNVGLVTVGGQTSYIAFELTDNVATIEVWLTHATLISSAQLYKGRKVLVCGEVSDDPYLHIVVESKDAISLLD